MTYLLRPVRMVGRSGQHICRVLSAFLETAYAHVDQHEQHALEVVQRLRVYSENYVEPTPPTSPNTRSAAVGPDAGVQTGLLDRSSRDH